MVTSVSNDEHGIVTVSDDQRHGFEDGDFIMFREVEGMTELNGNKFKIEVVSPFSFKIGDTTKFGQYTREGICEQVKVPFEVNHASLADALEEPLAKNEFMMQDPDMDFEALNMPY